jgi:hypothetical protein
MPDAPAKKTNDRNRELPGISVPYAIYVAECGEMLQSFVAAVEACGSQPGVHSSAESLRVSGSRGGIRTQPEQVGSSCAEA